RLGLLPSGPDPVHGIPPRRTQPSTPRVHRPFIRQTHSSGGEFGPAYRGLRVEGTPNAPLSTISASVPLAASLEEVRQQRRRLVGEDTGLHFHVVVEATVLGDVEQAPAGSRLE